MGITLLLQLVVGLPGRTQRQKCLTVKILKVCLYRFFQKLCMEILKILVDIGVKGCHKKNSRFPGDSETLISYGELCYDMDQIRLEFP